MRKLKRNRQGVHEYVRLAELPDKQVGTFLEWLPQTFLTKVNEDERLLEDCVDYEDYEFWYEHFYKSDLDRFEEEI